MTLTLTAPSQPAARPPRLGVKIRPFDAGAAPAVREFNARLAAHGIRYRFPDDAPAAAPQASVAHGHFIAVDRDGAVRGGYIIKYQDYWVRGERRRLGFYRLPLSEGLAVPEYGIIGLQLLADALRRQPELFVLGIGGFGEPLARMLVRLGWTLTEVPFYFRVERPFRFARGIPHLRRTWRARVALDLAAFSGAAWAGTLAVRTARRRRPASATVVDVIDAFDAWADRIWIRSREQHSLVAVRNAESLNTLYPRGDRFIRLLIRRGAEPVGWAVVLDSQMSNHPYFGALRVGSIVDCLAEPGAAGAVVAHAAGWLRARGVDLIVSNQSAHTWRDALMAEGFLQRAAGFLFGASPALEATLAPDAGCLSQFHLTRGDGDGPINL